MLNRRYYGHAPTGSPYGVQMLGAGLGMALGGWIGGPIFDMFGSYNVALWISIVTSLAGALNILVLEPTDRAADTGLGSSRRADGAGLLRGIESETVCLSLCLCIHKPVLVSGGACRATSLCTSDVLWALRRQVRLLGGS